jgi:hypothetical protein
MILEPRRKIEVSFWGYSILIALTGLGWLIAAFVVGRVDPGTGWALVSAFGVDIFKAIFIGSSAGIGINLYLKHALGETPKAILERSGIDEVYSADRDRSARQSAATDFQRLIRNKRINKIDIIGASLRDFLTPAGNLHQAWEAMVERLHSEQNANEGARLRVRLLLLDPRSGEGRFRHNVEKTTISALGLPADVPQGIQAVYGIQGILQDFLQVRVYEHCPFAFMFATDTEAFVQQYGYRDHTKTSVIPLIKYLRHSDQYDELMHTFETIWKYADAERWNPHHIGAATAIEEARIKNIFRKEHRGSLSERQIECLSQVQPGSTVDILVITGNFYVTNDRVFYTLRDISMNQNGRAGAQVRFAILNPVSQQAILRAIAESSPADVIGDTLRSWSWTRHINSKLYQGAHYTMRSIELWQTKGCAFELHLYSSAVTAALLLTPDADFVEQYFYGRTRRFQQGLALGGEYPVFEYDVDEASDEERTEREILTSTFKVIWNFYSISLDAYEQRNEEEEFKKNLARLLEELNPQTPQKAVPASI